MKTKRKATRLPSSLPEATTLTSTPTANGVNPSLETHITCSFLTTKAVEPHSATKKAKFDNVNVRRSQRVQSAERHLPLIHNDDPVIQIIDPSGSKENDLGNSAQRFPVPELNQSRIEDTEQQRQNQYLAESEKGSEDNDSSEDNSIELEPEEPMNDKPTGSKNKSDMQYRTMYLESKKKLKKLTHANNELSKKLAVAEGKLEAYEKGSGILSSILDKTKDLFMTSALSSASEQLLARATPRAKPRKKTVPASKRKKPVASFR